MKKCKWAGDSGDEYCKDCNGCDMMVDGKSISCIECAGYEESDEEVTTAEETKEEPKEEIKEEPKEELPINPPVEETKEEKAKEDTTETKKPTQKTKNTTKTNKTTTKDENVDKTQNNKVTQETSAEEVPAGVGILALRYMSGITICHNDTYYKFSAEEEWSLDLKVLNTTEKIEDAREKLWAKLNAAVDKQVEDVINS